MPRYRRTPWIKITALLVVLAAGGIGLYYWLGEKDANGAEHKNGDSDGGGTADKGGTDNGGGEKAPSADEGYTVSWRLPGAPAGVTVAWATETYQAGLSLFAGDRTNLLAARGKLNQAYCSGALRAPLAEACRDKLAAIARQVVFSRTIEPGDTHARPYDIKSGDVLERIVKREKVFVSYKAIARINRMSDPDRIRPGDRIKLIQGPFDVVITKRSFTLDLYLHGTFVKRYPIGLGQNGSTPAGRWIVGKKATRAPWTPPRTAGLGSRVIKFGQPGYPFGKEGLWISLQGVDEDTKLLAGFGIHGTNDPGSIGKAQSLGCIRLTDDNIGELYDLLYTGGSQIEIRP